jgi:hypothetical protein
MKLKKKAKVSKKMAEPVKSKWNCFTSFAACG